jgi:LysM repeat protein
MNQIKPQFDDIFGKSVGELEKQIRKSKRTSVIAAQLKDRLFPLGVILLFVIMLAIIWGLRFEVSGLQSKISQLNNENTSLKEQLDAQAKQVLPAAKTSDDQSTGELIYHAVQPGDCFATISEQYYQADDCASELAKLNGLTIESTLHIGQIIRVPKSKADIKMEP